MNDQTATQLVGDDAAWASVNTPLTPVQLELFCHDIERLFRINPMLEIKEWQTLGENRYRINTCNISQQPPFELESDIEVIKTDLGLLITYSKGIKNTTTFKIEAAESGSKLTIIDNYDGLSEQQRQNQLNEVDKSIVTWAHYLQKYLISWNRWSRIPIWRWYMRRIWQPMKPSGRRITYMLLWISAFEIILIMLGVTIYYLEFK